MGTIKDFDKTNKTDKNLSENFAIYSVLFHDLFFELLQISVTLLLFVSILNLSKENANDLYPTDLKNKFYGDGKCDLGNMRPGESSFCDEYVLSETGDETKAGKSIFASKVGVYAKNMGYITSDSFSILLLWFSYLAFSCEHFSQVMLNGMQNIAKALYNIPFIIQFFIVVTLISVINNINLRFINPFLTKLFNIFNLFKVSANNRQNIFIGIAIELFVNLTSIFVLLFLFFMVPLTIYYVFSMCKILTENLSIQMNILTTFALFLCIKALSLFVEFMQDQFGADAIRRQTAGKSDKAQAILNAGIQNTAKFNSFISSYVLYFFIPIIVALVKMYKLIITLISNMNPLGLETKYKLMFISIILLSFYYPIKNDLDYSYNFPYSIIYAVIAIISVAFVAYKNKSTIT